MKIGDQLNLVLNLNGLTARYSKDGSWFHHPKEFPAYFFDRDGYVLVSSEEEYQNDLFFSKGKSTHVKNGISSLKSYIFFSPQQKIHVKAIFLDTTTINAETAWKQFNANAKNYFEEKEVFFSPTKKKRYHITSLAKNVITITRLDEINSIESIGKIKFKTCIERLNSADYPIERRSIYEHVVEETTIVELLPMLDWSEDGKSIVFSDFYNRPKPIISESSKNIIIDKRLTFLNIRRGQKKFRKKLMELYNGCCAISGCNTIEVLHACHIEEHAVSGNNLSTNGVLLRADIHDLFDSYLVGIHPQSLEIQIGPALINTEYECLHARNLASRNDSKKLETKSLERRWEIFLSNQI